MLGGLALGLIAGAGVAWLGDGPREPLLRAATIIGGLWLNALKMTVIPLIVALLIIGIAQGAEAVRAGRIAGLEELWEGERAGTSEEAGDRVPSAQCVVVLAHDSPPTRLPGLRWVR